MSSLMGDTGQPYQGSANASGEGTAIIDPTRPWIISEKAYYGPEAKLSAEEISIFEGAKLSNRWYFEALVRAAGIMAQRRAKYSPNKDPFENFKIVGRVLGEPVRVVFRHYQALKWARILANPDGDFQDESAVDSQTDLANYCLLEVGYMQQAAEEQFIR